MAATDNNTNEAIIVAARKLSKTVDTVDGPLTILDNISLTINAGETLAILGASGSGKSTLLGLLAGLDSPSTGDILLCGQSLTDLDEDGRAQVRALKVGFVFQSFHLLPTLSALENCMLPLEIHNDAYAESHAKSLLERVGLASRLNHHPAQLSGGEQQRVAIARAFVTEPAVLFADEPTGNLDTHTGQRIIDLLFDLNCEKNTTLVLVTHDPQLASRCNRHLHLDAGRLV